MGPSTIIEAVKRSEEIIKAAYQDSWIWLKKYIESKPKQELSFYKCHCNVPCHTWDTLRVNSVQIFRIFLKDDKLMFDVSVRWQFNPGESKTFTQYDLCPEAGYEILKVIYNHEL